MLLKEWYHFDVSDEFRYQLIFNVRLADKEMNHAVAVIALPESFSAFSIA